MTRVLLRFFLREVVIVAGVAIVTIIAAQSARGGAGDRCNTYIDSCAINTGSCCLAVGSQYSSSTPTGQTLSAFTITPATQCAAKFKPGWLYGCSSTVTGVCGGPATSADCY